MPDSFRVCIPSGTQLSLTQLRGFAEEKAAPAFVAWSDTLLRAFDQPQPLAQVQLGASLLSLWLSALNTHPVGLYSAVLSVRVAAQEAAPMNAIGKSISLQEVSDPPRPPAKVLKWTK